MKILKHSKFKNTAIIFDVLARQLVNEAMSGSSNKALTIIKNHFRPDSVLSKELRLYRGLVSHNIGENVETIRVLNYINTIVNARKQLSETILKTSKFNLVKAIKTKYGAAFLEEGFSTRLPKYKELASAYKLFEYTISDNPSELLSCSQVISESLIGVIEQSNNPWKDLSPGVRSVGFKNLLEGFNAKYSNFLPAQKLILQEYINNPMSFPEFFIAEIKSVSAELTTLSANVTAVNRIKLTEMCNLLRDLSNAPKILDDHISVILKCHGLIDELKSNE